MTTKNPDLKLNSLIVIPSSQVNNDSANIPALGINPDLIQIQKNTANIALKADESVVDLINAQVNKNTADIALKANATDLETTNAQVSQNTENITNNTTNITANTAGISSLEARVNTNAGDITDLNVQVSTNTNNIANNTTNINTINDIITEAFTTYGTYTTSSSTLSGTEEIRPNLSEIVAMDANYVVVQLEPNLFTNLSMGRVIFRVGISNYVNDELEKLVNFNIYKNGEKEAVISKIFEANETGSLSFVGAINVEVNDEVYFTYNINEEAGSLTVNSPISYNVEFSSNSVQATKSSELVNDKNTIANTGINPDLIKIDENKNEIDNINLVEIPALEDKINEYNGFLSELSTDLYLNQLPAIKDRLTALETLTTQQSQTISNLQAQITQRELSVGSIVISLSMPQYGTWEDLGILADGQALIGGYSSAGELIRHNHRVLWRYGKISKGQTSNDVINGLTFFDSTGNELTIGRESDIDVPAYTGFAGNGPDYNKAYGLGIGSNIHVWRRTA